jgi:hypothetical protein
MRLPWGRWNRPPENRGTLTFTRDGMVFLGVPEGTNDETLYGLMHLVAEWVKDGQPPKVLVFPFPVDIVDNRA